MTWFPGRALCVGHGAFGRGEVKGRHNYLTPTKHNAQPSRQRTTLVQNKRTLAIGQNRTKRTLAPLSQQHKTQTQIQTQTQKQTQEGTLALAKNKTTRTLALVRVKTNRTLALVHNKPRTSARPLSSPKKKHSCIFGAMMDRSSSRKFSSHATSPEKMTVTNHIRYAWCGAVRAQRTPSVKQKQRECLRSDALPTSQPRVLGTGPQITWFVTNFLPGPRLGESAHFLATTCRQPPPREPRVVFGPGDQNVRDIDAHSRGVQPICTM